MLKPLAARNVEKRLHGKSAEAGKEKCNQEES
jgi:hypothetical protein